MNDQPSEMKAAEERGRDKRRKEWKKPELEKVPVSLTESGGTSLVADGVFSYS